MQFTRRTGYAARADGADGQRRRRRKQVTCERSSHQQSDNWTNDGPCHCTLGLAFGEQSTRLLKFVQLEFAIFHSSKDAVVPKKKRGMVAASSLSPGLPCVFVILLVGVVGCCAVCYIRWPVRAVKWISQVTSYYSPRPCLFSVLCDLLWEKGPFGI